MPIITINNESYELDSLSEDAKSQIQSIQFCDQELGRLQAQTAVLQTARAAYAKALQAVLPVPAGVGDTIQFS